MLCAGSLVLKGWFDTADRVHEYFFGFPLSNQLDILNKSCVVYVTPYVFNIVQTAPHDPCGPTIHARGVSFARNWLCPAMH